MYEILKGNEDLSKQLLHNHSDMMFAGVVAGNNSGKIWVDSLEEPASAIVWSEGLQCFQFMGCANNQAFTGNLKYFIDGPIINFLREKKLDFFECSSDTEEWYPIIHMALSNRKIKESWQCVYKSNLNFHKMIETSLPCPYKLYTINSEYLSSTGNGTSVSNPEFLIGYIEQFWGSIENYLNRGYGYLAADDEQIASFAITTALCKETYSIGVETLEQHRRKGLAGNLTKSLINTLCEKGCSIWWDCMESNIASQKTAESADLALDHKYRVCWFNFD